MLIKIKENKTQEELKPKEIWEIGQQPIDKSGYTNPLFNRKYGDQANPFTGSDRDRRFKKKYF